MGGGAKSANGLAYAVINPATLKPIAQVPDMNVEETQMVISVTNFFTSFIQNYVSIHVTSRIIISL